MLRDVNSMQKHELFSNNNLFFFFALPNPPTVLTLKLQHKRVRSGGTKKKWSLLDSRAPLIKFKTLQVHLPSYPVITQ